MLIVGLLGVRPRHPRLPRISGRPANWSGGLCPPVEVPSGPEASNDGRNCIDIDPVLDNETDVGFPASEDDDTGGQGLEWTRGVKFHRVCKCRKSQSRSEAAILTWRRVFPSCKLPRPAVQKSATTVTMTGNEMQQSPVPLTHIQQYHSNKSHRDTQ